MAKRSLVDTKPLKGCLDLLPEQVLPRKAVIRTIETLFELHGFSPVETPALEPLEVLLGAGGEESNKELFRLESPEGDPIALRFDLTVPFARLLAAYPETLKVPFRRYAVGPVWRADKPDPGRYRQFTQVDADIAGADTVAVDAEIISLMCGVMAALEVEGFRVMVNNRKIIDALLVGAGVLELDKQKHVLRVIDKLQKVGVDNVRRELGSGRVDISGDPIPGVELAEATIEAILTFVSLEADSRGMMVDAMAQALGEGDAANKAIAEMRELAEALEGLGVSESHVVFDPSLARGLDYYTGPVFEMILTEARQFGTVMAGGRYDGLVERFLDRPIPATGMSVGLDRLLAALSHLGLAKTAATATQVLVVSLGNIPKGETLRVARELREAGIPTEPYFAKRKKMKMGDQLSHADHYGIPVAVILGEDELAGGKVSVKDLQHGKEAREDIEDRDAYREAGKTGQATVLRSEMIETVQNILARQV